jgi:hypothetical protein
MQDFEPGEGPKEREGYETSSVLTARYFALKCVLKGE